MADSLSLISRRLLAVVPWGDSGSEELSEDPSDPASKAKVKKSLFTATYTFQISPTCTLRRATGDGGLRTARVCLQQCGPRCHIPTMYRYTCFRACLHFPILSSKTLNQAEGGSVLPNWGWQRFKLRQDVDCQIGPKPSASIDMHPYMLCQNVTNEAHADKSPPSAHRHSGSLHRCMKMLFFFPLWDACSRSDLAGTTSFSSFSFF